MKKQDEVNINITHQKHQKMNNATEVVNLTISFVMDHFSKKLMRFCRIEAKTKSL